MNVTQQPEAMTPGQTEVGQEGVVPQPTETPDQTGQEDQGQTEPTQPETPPANPTEVGMNQ